MNKAAIDTHIGLIDKESVRLVTPLLQQNNEISEAYFLGDNSQIQTFQRIKKILSTRNVMCYFHEITSEPAPHELVHNLRDFCTELNKKKRNILFNASCGLRFRLLSAYEVFKEFDWPTFVLELETNEICWMSEVTTPPPLKRSGKISVSEWLTVFGAEVHNDTQLLPIKEEHQTLELAHKWATNANHLTQAFSVLNYLATSCRKSGSLDVELSEKQLGYAELREVLDQLTQHKLIKMNGPLLTFTDEHSRAFCNGQWLTDYVFYTLESLKEDISCINDIAYNVSFNRRIGDMVVKNKFDVASIVNNKLFIIECKTKSMKDAGDDTLYKLDSLREFIGGVQSKSMLITLKSLRSSDVTRSQDLGVTVIGPELLPHLKKVLQEWIHTNKYI
ncbi:DUF1887 family protein [Photobacterium leiognathi]|uniref:Card1-like endonuclease domain-containing protein n=1 Tax=Photobacterium leiognathi TaxID=553611 RepID=UPI001EDF6AC4|nr:DUF1887 family CARF protein [Photobacterium leiognathi]MCG3884464.1 DUF1887 family protein [Photobacterium leiognathi]